MQPTESSHFLQSETRDDFGRMTVTRGYLKEKGLTSENHTKRFIFRIVTTTRCWEENHIGDMKEDESSPCKLIVFQKPFFPKLRCNLESRAELEFRSWQLVVQGREEVPSK